MGSCCEKIKECLGYKKTIKPSSRTRTNNKERLIGNNYINNTRTCEAAISYDRGKSKIGIIENSNYNFSRDSNKVDTVSCFDFKKVACIGKGSFGTVYLVQHKRDNTYYAMKELKKATLMRLKQVENTKTERVVLEKVKSPFISTLYYAFQSSESLFLVTDFLQGGDLFFHLTRMGIFTLEQVRFYSAEIVLALAKLHSHGIIYRDLKLENILLDCNGHIKLVDFGLAKIIKNNDSTKTNSLSDTESHSFCGTSDYMAPEVLKGSIYDYSVDFWALGVLIYEMAEGVVPFKLTKRDIRDSFNPKDFLEFSNCKDINLKAIITELLDMNQGTRLGSGPNGVAKVKNHSFFNSINWDKIGSRKVEPPFKPIIYGNEDVSNFDNKFTSEVILSEVKEKERDSLNGRNSDRDSIRVQVFPKSQQQTDITYLDFGYSHANKTSL